LLLYSCYHVRAGLFSSCPPMVLIWRSLLIGFILFIYLSRPSCRDDTSCHIAVFFLRLALRPVCFSSFPHSWPFSPFLFRPLNSSWHINLCVPPLRPSSFFPIDLYLSPASVGGPALLFGRARILSLGHLFLSGVVHLPLLFFCRSLPPLFLSCFFFPLPTTVASTVPFFTQF